MAPCEGMVVGMVEGMVEGMNAGSKGGGDGCCGDGCCGDRCCVGDCCVAWCCGSPPPWMRAPVLPETSSDGADLSCALMPPSLAPPEI